MMLFFGGMNYMLLRNLFGEMGDWLLQYFVRSTWYLVKRHPVITVLGTTQLKKET
jgi:hypothetical protein